MNSFEQVLHFCPEEFRISLTVLLIYLEVLLRIETSSLRAYFYSMQQLSARKGVERLVAHIQTGILNQIFGCFCAIAVSLFLSRCDRLI